MSTTSAARRARHRLGDLAPGGLRHRDVELARQPRDDHVVPLLDLHLSQVGQQASPPRCPSRRLRLTVVPCSPGCTATVSISVRIRSRPLPWSSSRSERQLPWSCTAISISVPVALARHLEAGAVRGAGVLDRVRGRLAARGRDLGDLELVRAGVRAASGAACCGSARATPARPGTRRVNSSGIGRLQSVRSATSSAAPPGRDQRGEQVVEQALRVVRRRRAPPPRAARGRRRGARRGARRARPCRAAACRRARAARSPPRRSGTAARRAAPTPSPSRKRGSPRDITSGGGWPAFTQRTRAGRRVDDHVEQRRHLALLGLGPQQPVEPLDDAAAVVALERVRAQRAPQPADHRRRRPGPCRPRRPSRGPTRAAGDRDHVVPVAAHLGLGRRRAGSGRPPRARAARAGGRAGGCAGASRRSGARARTRARGRSRAPPARPPAAAA